VLRRAGNDYLVAGNAREGRFGIDEQPKFWVKSAIELKTGVRKCIICRIVQSTTHLISTSVMAVQIRFFFFLIQLAIGCYWTVRFFTLFGIAA
jgi:hypothetical protein